MKTRHITLTAILFVAGVASIASPTVATYSSNLKMQSHIAVPINVAVAER